MTNLRKIYEKLLKDYSDDYDTVCRNEGYYGDFDTFDNCEDDDDILKEVISGDLLDKKFTDDEIQEIFDENETIETMCKFIAYACSLNNPDCSDSLDKLRETIVECTSEQIDDDMLQKIDSYMEQIDY